MDACSLTIDGSLRFRDGPGVEARLRELMRLENECCPAARLTRERDGDALVLGIEA